MVDTQELKPPAEVVYFHAIDGKGHLITVQGVLVEQKEHSLTVQHSNGGQHTYFTAYNLADLKYGNSFRVFAYKRPGIDEYERLFRLPEIVHPDGNPETLFDADKYAIEELPEWQAADVTAGARAVAADLLAEEEDLKAQVLDLIRQLQATGKVAANYVQDVGLALGIEPSLPATTITPATGQASIGVTQRSPVMFSRRTLPVQSAIITSTPVSPSPVPPTPAPPAKIPSDRVVSTRAGKKKKVKAPKAELLSRADMKQLKKKTGWLNA